ncbi:thymidine phosphorylase [Halocynthiibacter namhaensis]|uniref:thymidine phosphorylase n=1 Tax=Halocynthiibacter namhaensis TaxID=1290553 RepID=UPI000578EC46|nr:thymidine phosphorylase [Halocynthiibacter namhaensis]
MDARSIILGLREKRTLSVEEIHWFARGLSDGTVSDAQAGAFAMATCLNGLGDAGRVALTEAMRDSGDVMTWDLPGPVVDKHSTGGVGDCVSLILAPALAACGAYVPMISGRGLGHTGGTLDKLEAIPGVNTEVSETKFRQMVGGLGCAIVSATGDIAPADKRLYAVRDVTSTVESIDLITASILSKKLAAGLETLVLDVKCGSGAFMGCASEASELANALVSTAKGAGCSTLALVTDMNSPLAPAAGNALEVRECLRVLEGRQDGVLLQLTAALGGALLVAAKLATDEAKGRSMIRAVIASGQAREVLAKMVAALGGPTDVSETCLPEASVVLEVQAKKTGHISEIDVRALGEAVVHLGGGRLYGGQKLDMAVGLSQLGRVGDHVEQGGPLAMVHAANEAAAEHAAKAVLSAIVIAGTAAPTPLILETVE